VEQFRSPPPNTQEGSKLIIQVSSKVLWWSGKFKHNTLMCSYICTIHLVSMWKYPNRRPRSLSKNLESLWLVTPRMQIFPLPWVGMNDQTLV
jgi:hypothetical protein